MITATTATILTDREALARARSTYEELYRSLLDGKTGEERERIDRVHARGVAAFDGYRPTGGFLPSAAADTLGVYLDGAAHGDADARLAWLKMMPRMLVEVTANVEAPLVFEPATWVTLGELTSTLVSTLHTETVLSHHVNEVRVSYVATPVNAVSTWKVLAPTHWLRFEHWYVARTKPEPEPPRGNRQSTLALAA